VELGVAVVNPVFSVRILGSTRVTRGEVKLAREPAGVPLIGEHSRYRHLVGGDVLTVLPTPRRTWVSPGEKTCPAGHTHWALAETALEADSLVGELVKCWRRDMIIAIGPQCVEALLVSTNPQNVRWCHTSWEGPDGKKSCSKLSDRMPASLAIIGGD